MRKFFINNIRSIKTKRIRINYRGSKLWDKFSINANYQIGDTIMVNLGSHSISGILSKVDEDSLMLIDESESGEQFANNILFEHILLITQKLNIHNVNKLIQDNDIKDIDIPLEEDNNYEDDDYDEDVDYFTPEPG